MAEWYCAPGGQQIGPFGEERLREMARTGQIGPDDAVWCPGMTDWVPAGTVPGLLAAPPPMPASPAGLPSTAPPPPGGPLPVVPLSYATPAAAAAPFMAPAPFIAPQYDPGPFERVGKLFKVNAARWGGVVVVSPIAFYMLKVAQRQDPGYGGVVGYMLASAINRSDTTRTCDLSQLPSPVVQALDARGKHMSGDVIIVRRDAVSRLTTSWMGIVTARVGGDRFEMTTPMFAGRRIRHFLTANGWTLNAELMPTSGPTYGRPDGAPAPLSAGERAARFAIGLVIIVVIVVLRVGCSMNHQRY